MANQEFILLNGKEYRVQSVGAYEPTVSRPKQYSVGLTGKSLIQDFTVASRVPKSWGLTLAVYIDQIETTRPNAGNWSDLLTAYYLPSVPFVEHDDSVSHVVGIANDITQIPRVPADIFGDNAGCPALFYIDVFLIKIFS